MKIALVSIFFSLFVVLNCHAESDPKDSKNAGKIVLTVFYIYIKVSQSKNDKFSK
jgi:hypothetical protein